MPTYEFECQKCRKHFAIEESFEKHDRHRQHKCPKCGSTRTQQMFASVHVKTSTKS